MRTFTATTEGQSRLGLRELLRSYANEQWIAGHYTLEEAADISLDCFKRLVKRELELLELRCADVVPRQASSSEAAMN
jgi:hypothetical protein